MAQKTNYTKNGKNYYRIAFNYGFIDGIYADNFIVESTTKWNHGFGMCSLYYGYLGSYW